MRKIDADTLIHALMIMSEKNDSSVWGQCIEIVQSLPTEEITEEEITEYCKTRNCTIVAHEDLVYLRSINSTIDAAPVRHGKWNKVKHYDNIFSCSYCGELTTETVMGIPRFNFCPNCGARMVK